MDTRLKAQSEKIDAQLWGRLYKLSGRQATKTDVDTMLSEQVDQKIRAAEEAARARAAKFRTLKTRHQPQGLFRQVIRRIFG